jgi:two-component system CheB/CheR fusion protein
MPLDFAQSARFLETEAAFKSPGRDGTGQDKAAQSGLDLLGALDGVLPARYVPNGVIVNGDLEILRFLGNTSSYLRPAPGKPSMNLRRMASSELLLELRTAIHVAKKSACAVRKEITAPRHGGPAVRVQLEVVPVNAPNLNLEYFLVLFEELSAAEPGKLRTEAAAGAKDSRRVIELKEDLAVSGEHLKAIIEEQESTNARLKASNEELLSGNEELQSVNEEFETSKEELQSTNEELITSTEELGDANQVLNRANSDFSNLLANIDIPIVLLDPDLTVRRYTPPAEQALDMSPDKIGRPIADIRLPLLIPNLRQLLTKVIRTGQVEKQEIQDGQGRWHYLIIRPYRTDRNKTEKTRTEGAVMALVDIQDRKLAEKNIQRLAAVVLDSNDSVIIIDMNDRITAWNYGAQKMYGYTEAEAMGMNIKRLVPEKLRVKARDLVRVSAKPIETQRRAKDGRILDVLLTVTVLRDDKGQPVEVATTERDITEQKRAERELRGLHARSMSAEETERKRLSRELHDGVGQILSGVKFRLESLPGELTLDEKAAGKIVKVGGLLSQAISEIRRVSQNLMPSELVDLGLEPALRTLCREFKERAGVPVTLKAVNVPADLSSGLALGLYRITQEALNNIGKHSKADLAGVELSRKGKELILRVSDDGVGFTPGAKRPVDGRGIGLGSMRERAELLGGSLELISKPGVGTTLTVRVPLAKPAGDQT